MQIHVLGIYGIGYVHAPWASFHVHGQALVSIPAEETMALLQKGQSTTAPLPIMWVKTSLDIPRLILSPLQGDVIGPIDGSGNIVVEYKYDAWGRLLSTAGSLAGTVGKLNPFRYRGYIYDEETGLYYLKSRYYNPEWGRFISADAVLGKVGGVLSHNLFAYCANGPVSSCDPAGATPTACIRAICVTNSSGKRRRVRSIISDGFDVIRSLGNQIASFAKAMAWLQVPDAIASEITQNMRANGRTSWWGYRSGINSFTYYAQAPQGYVRIDYYMINYTAPFSIAEACEFGLACASLYDEFYLANMAIKGVKGFFVEAARFGIQLANMDGISIPWPAVIETKEHRMLESNVTILEPSDYYKSWAGMF